MALCAAGILYFVLAPAVKAPEASSALTEAAEDLDEYNLTMTFDPDARTLAITEKITLTNRTGDTLSDIVLRTYAGAYQSEDDSPCATVELHAVSYPDGFSEGGIRVTDTWWNGEIVPYAFDDDAMTVLRVPTGTFEAGETGELLLHCVIDIPVSAGRFGYYEDVYTLGNIIPILSVYENGAWRSESYCPIGDPFCSESANYSVTLRVPTGYTPVSTAVLSTQDGEIYKGSALCVRDFSMAIGSRFQVSEKMQSGVLVRCVGDTKAETDRMLKYAADAIRIYGELYGAYPWPQYTVCAVSFPIGGMEYPCLTFIDRDFCVPALEGSLEWLIAHETAHQWFYSLVGSDEYYEPWQDEAASQFAALEFIKKREGYDAYQSMYELYVNAPMQENIEDGVTPGSPVTYFADLDEYTCVVYGRGAAMFAALDLASNGRMNEFLRLYCERFAYKLASRADFEELIQEFTGSDYHALMVDYLDTFM